MLLKGHSAGDPVGLRKSFINTVTVIMESKLHRMDCLLVPLLHL